MNKKSVLKSFSCAIALLVASSCGSTNSGPAVAAFKTVTVTGSILTPATPVSVFAGTSCSNDVHTGVATVTNTPVSVIFTSTVYPEPTSTTTTATTATGQPVTINGYSVSFKPLNGGPAISDPVGGGFTGQVLPGGTLTLPVLISSFKTEGILQTDPNLSKCAAFSYDYLVTITFFGTELGGTNANIVVTTTLTYTNSL